MADRRDDQLLTVSTACAEVSLACVEAVRTRTTDAFDIDAAIDDLVNAVIMLTGLEHHPSRYGRLTAACVWWLDANADLQTIREREPV